MKTRSSSSHIDVKDNKANKPKPALPIRILRTIGIVLALVIVIAAAVVAIFAGNRIRSLATIEQVSDYPAVRMTHYGDCGLDKLLETGIYSDKQLSDFVTERLTYGELFADYAEGMGCTCYTAQNEKGETLYCRNFDYSYNPPMLMHCKPGGGDHDSFSISGMTFVNYDKYHIPTGLNLDSYPALGLSIFPCDGVNEKGVAVSLLYIPNIEGTLDNGKTPIHSNGFVRLILDRAGSVDEALELMSGYDIFYSSGKANHFLIADRSGRSVIVEFVYGEMHVIENNLSYQAASNHIAYNDMNTSASPNSLERYNAVIERLALTNGIISEEEAMELLVSVGGAGGGNDSLLQWSAVYNLDTGNISIVTGGNLDAPIYDHIDITGKE